MIREAAGVPTRGSTDPTGTKATMTTQQLPAEGTVTMYSTPWCGYCRRLKTQLDSVGIAYTEVDIEQTPDAAAYVEQVNGGNQTVPTVLFPDGSAATNPSLLEVRSRLEA
jgi:mycoredoxin